MTSIHITADANIPMPDDPDAVAKLQYLERARAAFATIRELTGDPDPAIITQEDRDRGRKVVLEDKPIRKVIEEKDAGMLAYLDAMLTAYDFELIDSANRLRNYVTNRLLKESDHPDPKIRLRALELLGKTSNVRAFSETMTVNVNHRNVDDVDEELRQLAMKYMGPAKIVDDSDDGQE